MKIENNVSLQKYNTFGFDYSAQNLIRIRSERDILDILEQNLSPLKILGGGSNILLTQPVSGYLLKNEIDGIVVRDEDENTILVQVGSGENWHTLVLWCLSHNFGGLENLSYIPGTVGAAPIQNIGAYGIEQNSVFHSLSAIHLRTGERKTFANNECKFGYRDSIFKRELKDQYMITQVTYALKKKDHKLTYQYGAIQSELNKNNISHPTIQDISQAVIFIRKSKLPDPKDIGNAGSFFKNPVIESSLFKKLQDHYPDIPSFLTEEVDKIKIPAGWLIEKMGFKGLQNKNVGVHKNQALVLVHYGNGQGSSILKLAQDIQKSVKDTFFIDLQPEVNIW